MNDHSHRYVFIEFEDLKKIKFRKLEQVSDRVFIFIDSEEKNIPFSLVRQMQKLGDSAKWIPLDKPGKSLSFHVSFFMGMLHGKVDLDIEFAVLSNDSILDSVIQFINDEGRSCIRVQRDKSKENPNAKSLAEESGFSIVNQQASPVQESVTNPNVSLEETAKDTIRRLIRSGNRPAEIESLKSYILLHHKDSNDQEQIDQIIKKLEETEEIQIQNELVSYNF